MATRTISTKLAVEGESQYKQAIASCNSELSTLKSSLALVESEYEGNANSMEALTAKGDALTAIYDKQREKVDTLEKALANAQEAQRTYSDRVATAQENIERCEKALDDLKDSTEDTSAEQAALTAELEGWSKELQEAEGYQTAAERGVNNWQKQLNLAKIDLNDLDRELENNNQYLAEAEESADGCAQSIDEFGNETASSASALEDLSTALAGLGITKALKEFGDALLECSSSAMTFETALAKLSTLVDETAVPMSQLEGELLSLSSETGVAATQLSEAMYQALSAGVETADAIEFVATATKLSAAGFTEAATAVDVMTTALNAYGLEGSETERVASMLVKTQDLGKTSVDELAASMGRVIPTAAAYGVGLDNLSAAYATLTKNGINTQIATTDLNAMLNELASSSSEVAAILEKETGKSFSQLMDAGQSLGDAIGILSDSVGGSADAFSNLWSSSTAGAAALTLLNEGSEAFNITLLELQGSTGMVEQNFGVMADTTEFAQQRMTNAAENLKIAIGERLNPALEAVYNLGTAAFTWATDFVSNHPALLSAISGLTAALAVLAGGAALAALVSVLPRVTALIHAFNVALMANPIIAVAAAVTGLAVAIAGLVSWTNSADKEVKQFCESLEASKDSYEELADNMAAEWQSIDNTTKALLELVGASEKSADQNDVILDMVGQLNEAIPDLGLAYNEMTGEINMTAEALENLVEKSAAQEEYDAQIARRSELYIEQQEIAARLADAEAELNQAYEEGQWFTGKLENNVRDLAAALEENEAEYAALEEATREYAEQQAQIAAQTNEMENRVNSLIAEMEALQAAYDESYQSAYNSISQTLGLFNELDATAKTSIDNLVASLETQIEFMDTYAENIVKAMEMGVDEGLVQKLSDGSEESAQILAAIVEGGEEEIALLNEKLAQVEEGKEDFSATVAELETEFNEKMDELVDDLNKCIVEMDVADETYAIGVDNIQGLIDGAESQRQALIATYRSLAEDALAAYKEVMRQMSPSRAMREAGSNDVLGLIVGVEGEREKLVSTYESLGAAALEALEHSLPSSIEEPSATAVQERQTAELVRALTTGRERGGDTNVYITAPESMDEKTAAREFKKAQRDLSLEAS